MNTTPASGEGGDYQIASGVTLPKQPRMVPGCTITEQDLDILTEGASAGRHRASRDVAIGLSASGLLGLLGVLAASPTGSFEKGVSGWTLAFLVVHGALFLGAGAVAVVMQLTAAAEANRGSYTKCEQRVRRALADGTVQVPASPVVKPT